MFLDCMPLELLELVFARADMQTLYELRKVSHSLYARVSLFIYKRHLCQQNERLRLWVHQKHRPHRMVAAMPIDYDPKTSKVSFRMTLDAHYLAYQPTEPLVIDGASIIHDQHQGLAYSSVTGHHARHLFHVMPNAIVQCPLTLFSPTFLHSLSERQWHNIIMTRHQRQQQQQNSLRDVVNASTHTIPESTRALSSSLPSPPSRPVIQSK